MARPLSTGQARCCQLCCRSWEGWISWSISSGENFARSDFRLVAALTAWVHRWHIDISRLPGLVFVSAGTHRVGSPSRGRQEIVPLVPWRPSRDITAITSIKENAKTIVTSCDTCRLSSLTGRVWFRVIEDLSTIVRFMQVWSLNTTRLPKFESSWLL